MWIQKLRVKSSIRIGRCVPLKPGKTTRIKYHCKYQNLRYTWGHSDDSDTNGIYFAQHYVEQFSRERKWVIQENLRHHIQILMASRLPKGSRFDHFLLYTHGLTLRTWSKLLYEDVSLYLTLCQTAPSLGRSKYGSTLITCGWELNY